MIVKRREKESKRAWEQCENPLESDPNRRTHIKAYYETLFFLRRKRNRQQRQCLCMSVAFRNASENEAIHWNDFRMNALLYDGT